MSDTLPAPAPGSQPPRLLDQLRDLARDHFNRPEPGVRYADWARRFILFHGKRHPKEMAEPEINAFLEHLAVDGPVSSSTQTQALSAILSSCIATSSSCPSSSRTC